MRGEANIYVGLNFIPDNPKMATPPAFWLKRLYDFDSMLVVIPSRFVPFAYVLGRRRQHSAGLTDKAMESTITQPDTKMCLEYGVVPVSLIYRTGEIWSIDNIIATLKRRDIWAHGGAEKAADALDAADASKEAGIKRAVRDDMYNRSGDAWRSYQARTGERNHHARNSGLRAKSPSGSTAGLGKVTLT